MAESDYQYTPVSPTATPLTTKSPKPAKMSTSNSTATTIKTSNPNLRFLQLAVTLLCIHGTSAIFTEALFTNRGFKYGYMYAWFGCFFNGWFVLLEALLGFGLNSRYYSRREFFTALGFIRSSPRESGDASELRNVAGKEALGKAAANSSSKNLLPHFRFRDALLTGLVWAVAHAAGSAAYVHINYTLVVIGKSSKVPATLLFAIFIQRNFRPSWQEVFGVLLFYVGLIVFGFGEKFESPKFEVLGLVLLGVNLVFGSVSANLQQRVLQDSLVAMSAGRRAASSTVSSTSSSSQDVLDPDPELRKKKLAISLLMTCQYFAAGTVIFIYMVFTGEFYDATAWYLTAGGRDGGKSLLPAMLGGAATADGGSELEGSMVMINNPSWNAHTGVIHQDFWNLRLGSNPAASIPPNPHPAIVPDPDTSHWLGFEKVKDAPDVNPADFATFAKKHVAFMQFLFYNWNPHWYAIGCTAIDIGLTYIGMFALFSLTQEFDATRCNATCSIRKALTFVLSYLLFPKPFSVIYHGMGVMLIFCGFASLHLGAERRRRREEAMRVVEVELGELGELGEVKPAE